MTSKRRSHINAGAQRRTGAQGRAGGVGSRCELEQLFLFPGIIKGSEPQPATNPNEALDENPGGLTGSLGLAFLLASVLALACVAA